MTFIERLLNVVHDLVYVYAAIVCFLLKVTVSTLEKEIHYSRT